MDEPGFQEEQAMVYKGLIVATLTALHSRDDRSISAAIDSLSDLSASEVGEFFFSLCGLTMGLAHVVCVLNGISIEDWLQKMALA